MNHFVIITPSYNNSEWVEYNLASILNQTYTDYEVRYIDDCSNDDTYEKVMSIVGTNPKFKVMRNEVNKGATYNYMEFLEGISDTDILVHLDGDDWLFDETVLEKLDKLYTERDYWMTYGKFFVYDGSDTISEANPQNTPYPDFVQEHKLYRQDTWRASHLRTYRAWLFKAIDKADLKSKYNGEYFWHAGDLAFQFPVMEMCTPDRIGVVEFPTHIYNACPKNQVRTKERESVDNTKYENEIRTKRHYSVGGHKLPQVNVIGNFRECNSIPTKFSYVYGQSEGESDITLIQDMEILKYINEQQKINTGKIIADIHEAPHLYSQNEVYVAVKENAEKFDRILTFDSELLKLPNAVYRNGGGEVVLNKNVHTQEYPTLADASLIKLYTDKPKYMSFITSNKQMTTGHTFRLSAAKRVYDLHRADIDIYGKGIRDIQGKIEGLKDYKYSVAIENGCHTNYFTEKILDCFLTGTIPIYHGCPNIVDFFDTRGFYTFETEDELVELISKLSADNYNEKIEYVRANYETALTYMWDNDIIFDKYLKDLIA